MCLGIHLKSGTHQAGSRLAVGRQPTLGQRASDGQASLFGVFHLSALVGITSAAVCSFQHVESASGTSARVRNLIGCSVERTSHCPRISART